MDQKKIGEFIKKLRKDNNLTQKEFADKLGVTYQAVSKWENAKNMPDILLLKEISKMFNVDINELLMGEKKEIKLKNKSGKYLIIILLLVILVILLISILNGYNSNFEFKKMASDCDEFTLTGSAAYNKEETSLYISDVDYCGDETDIMYKEFNCVLYEEYQDTRTKITSCGSDNREMTLEEYLDSVKINVNNYESSCKMFSSSSLYLEIKALDNREQQITYQIPIKLEENCNN